MRHRRSTTAVVLACAVVGGVLAGAVPAVADAVPTPIPSAPAPSPSASGSSEALPAPALVARHLHRRTTETGSVVLRGVGLDDVATVSLGPASLGAPEHLGATRLRVTIGTAPAFAAATMRLVLHRRSNGAAVPTGVTVVYRGTGFRAREVRWAWVHLRARRYSWGHAYISRYDCANFASHALDAAGMGSSVLDVSSTSLRRRLLALGAVELPDGTQARNRVRVGDLVQFDWHPSAADPGDRDHTGIVTSVARRADGRVEVRYSAHTDGGNDPAIQLRIEDTMHRPHHDPHGRVYFLHLPQSG